MLPPRTALSRLDNRSEVCPDCGMEEAWEQYTLGKVYDWRIPTRSDTEYEVTFTVNVTYTHKVLLDSSYDENDDVPAIITDIIHDAIQNDHGFLDNCTVINEEFVIPQDIVVVSK